MKKREVDNNNKKREIENNKKKEIDNNAKNIWKQIMMEKKGNIQ